MKKLRVKHQGFKEKQRGEITVFLSLIFILILSLVGALIESASIRLTRNYRRADVALATESVFAEYQKELLERYEIFAIDPEVGNIEKRLAYYGATETENKVEGAELLTDRDGEPFYRAALLYMKNRFGLNESVQEVEEWEKQKENASYYETQMEENQTDLETALSEQDNPIAVIEETKKTGIMHLVLPQDITVSPIQIPTTSLPSVKGVQKGNYAPTKTEENLAEKGLFCQYLLECFGCFSESTVCEKAKYELEYLIAGKTSDKENLETVLEQMLGIRLGVNYVYLQTDSAKQLEAETLATSICALLTVPGISGIVKQSLLLAWAYGESIVELRTLMRGESISAVKTSETWTLDIQSLLDPKSWNETGREIEDGGMDYQEFLRILLMITKCEALRMRALDLMEYNLGVEMDECVTAVRIRSTCSLRKRLRYEFFTHYIYQ